MSPPGPPRYLNEDLAAHVRELIARGTYEPGEKLPSIRRLSRERKVSINTVLQAYSKLESAHVIEARPQSGYYVTQQSDELTPRPALGLPSLSRAKTVSLGQEPIEVLRRLGEPDLIPLGRVVPNSSLLPTEKLARMLGRKVRNCPSLAVTYAESQGLLQLRKEIAKYSRAAGCHFSPRDVLITNGCTEALSLALQATCHPGDMIAVNAPAFFSFLAAVEWMNLKIVEIPSTPQEGMSIEHLENALHRLPIRACLAVLNHNNPLGSVMPEPRKQQLVELLGQHGVPLIEDDIYGDLSFDGVRPVAAKKFDRTGLVIHCSSFSKTLAPGFRIGWVASERYLSTMQRMKALSNLTTATPTQLAISEFLADGSYYHHLRRVREVYASQVAAMRESVLQAFPAGTRVTQPSGGYFLWVELPSNVDSFHVYKQAERAGIGIAPGTIFSTGPAYRNCMRLNAALWTTRVEKAVGTVGSIVKRATA